MDANKIRIVVTTEGRLFFIEDNPQIYGFMYEGESIKKNILTVLPEELFDFFKNYGSRADIDVVNFFKNAFITLLTVRIRKKLNSKFSNNINMIKCNNITGDLMKHQLQMFDKRLYEKLMHIILNLAASIVRSFKKDFQRIRELKR